MGEESVFGKIKGDKSIWLIVLLLFLISIAAVYSSSSSLAYHHKKSTFDFLIQHSKYVLFGLVALYACYRIPLGLYRGWSPIILFAAIVLLALTLITGTSINGAERWLNVFGFSFQPAELAKIATILYTAKVLESAKLETYKEFFLLLVLPAGTVIMLIFAGSISTAALLTFTLMVVFIVFGIKWSYIFKTALVGLVVITIAFMLNYSFGMFSRIDTAVKRIERFVSKPEPNGKTLSAEELQLKADKTYQADMARLAITSVGVFGKGPGNSTQRYLLPHPYSDYIFAIIIEEWGLIGAMAVIMLYLTFLFRSIALAKKCTQMFSVMTVIGLAVIIVLQAFLHILVNVGILPVTGHTLPLISLGGSSIIIMSGAFGIILSVSRTIEKSNEVAAKNEEDEYGKEI